MKNLLKKMSMVLSLIVIGLSFNSINVKASTNDECSHCINNNIIEPKAIIYCDSSPNGKHEMYARGIGILYQLNPNGTKTLIYNNGCTWQCKYCKTVMVTKGEAALGQSIGKYATWNPGYITANWGTVLTAANIWYESSNTIPGYNFRYN